MVMGDRLRQLRKSNHLSHGDIEKRTGLLRCYISRAEGRSSIRGADDGRIFQFTGDFRASELAVTEIT
jgi:transcriptional regulator with XRE-family HTH domain